MSLQPSSGFTYDMRNQKIAYLKRTFANKMHVEGLSERAVKKARYDLEKGIYRTEYEYQKGKKEEVESARQDGQQPLHETSSMDNEDQLETVAPTTEPAQKRPPPREPFRCALRKEVQHKNIQAKINHTPARLKIVTKLVKSYSGGKKIDMDSYTTSERFWAAVLTFQTKENQRILLLSQNFKIINLQTHLQKYRNQKFGDYHGFLPHEYDEQCFLTMV